MAHQVSAVKLSHNHLEDSRLDMTSELYQAMKGESKKEARKRWGGVG